MVTIESLEVENGFTYRELSIRLDNQGLCYVTGLNGHGKSKPFDLLQLILYGVTSQGLRRDAVINRFAPETEGFCGTVTLRRPDGRYRIRQTRRHPKHGNSVRVYRWDEDKGKWATRWDGGGCPKRMDDAQALAQQLVGLKLHEFEGAVYLSQARVHTLIEGTPTERMRYIAQLFGLDVIDQAIARLRADHKEAQTATKELPGLEKHLEGLREEAACADPPGPEDLMAMEDALEAGRHYRDRLHQERDAARDALASENQAAQLERDILATQADPKGYEGLKTKLAELRKRHQDLQDQLRDGKARAKLLREATALQVPPEATQMGLEEATRQAEQADLDVARLTAAQTQSEKRRKAEARLARLPDPGVTYEVAVDQDRAAAQRVTANKEQVRLKRQHYDDLGGRLDSCEDGTCPTCGQGLDVAALKRMYDEVGAELAGLREVGAGLSRAMEEAEQQLDQAEAYRDAQEDVDRYQDVVLVDPDDVDAASDMAKRLRRWVKVLDQWDRLAVQIDQLPEVDLDHVGDRCKRASALIEVREEEVERAGKAASLTEQLERLPRADLAATEQRLGWIEQLLEQAQQAAQVVQDRLSRAKIASTQYDALVADIATYQAEVDALGVRRRRAEVLDYGVGVLKGLRRRRLHEVIQGVGEALPRFASIMFQHEPQTRFVVHEDGESLDLSAQRVVNGKAVAIPVKGFSGGEKQRLSVALVFTLHSLLESTKRPDLLMLDEVDGELDARGVASLMQLVRQVRSRYGTVVMSSHRPQIGGAVFDQTWHVVKRDETSTLTVQ